jgi:antitoxin component of MazEF toxin-antitoxin module
MKNQAEFVNNVVKQGNSLCVRIPSIISKELGLKEGKEISVTVIPRESFYKYDEKTIQKLLNIAKKIKKLRRYNELKQKFFIMLNFEFLKKTVSKKQINFIKEKKKEFGSKIIEEFIDWAMTFNKEAFITEKDGAMFLKSRYR